MVKTFNSMKRSSELLMQGVSDEEAAAILTEEAENADVTTIDDGAWLSMPDHIANEAEEEYRRENAKSSK